MSQDYYEQSERYLLGKMSEQEKAEFAQEVKTNKVLQKELEIAKAIMGSAALSAKQNVRAELNEIHNKHFSQESPTPPQEVKTLKIWPLVRNIAAVLVLGALLIYILLPKTATPEALYASYYSVPELELSYRGGNEDRIITKLNKYYESKNYASYITLADQQDSLIDRRPTLQFAKAIACMETGNQTSSIPIFEQLIGNPLHRDRAQWYLALSYLKEGNIEKAKSIFKELAESQGKYKNEAIAILDNL